MAIKNTDSYFFFESENAYDKKSDIAGECVGICRSDFWSDLYEYRDLSRLERLWKKKPVQKKLTEDVTVVAGMWFTRKKNFLYVNNVAADESFGPTMYASILELARDENLKGVVPTQDPSKIVPKAKEIWRQFSERPDIVLTPLQSEHVDEWMQNSFALLPGKSPADLSGMRARYIEFQNSITDPHIAQWRESTIGELVREFIKKSATAFGNG